MTTRFLLAGAAALALAACGDDADRADVATDDTLAAGDQTLSTIEDPSMPTTAQEFATMQAASDLYEVEAGRLAQENGQSEAVRNFGTMMERDHLESTENLRQAASQASGVTVDPQMTAPQQSDLEALRGAGENFDSVYKRQQVLAHEKALAMLSNYAQVGDDEALQDFATQTASVVEDHLEQARDLP